MVPEEIIYVVIPLVSGFIGWFTNAMAVKMIFRPYNPVKILGLTFHGLIPRRHMDLAEKIGDTIEKELISHEDITHILHSPEVEAQLNGFIEKEVDRFLDEKLGSLPMVSMFLQGDMALKIRGMLLEQLSASIPNLMESMTTGLEEKINFKEIVKKKIEGFDYSKLEKIIYDIAAKELKMIEILGGVLGFVVGLGQIALLYFNK